jgi:hypothetical protein
MQADNTKAVIHIYKPKKVNKTSTIYEIEQTHENRISHPEDYFTELVKIEQYQGFSKAYNVSHYFRIRNTSNWSKCETPTGLFKTLRANVYIGDLKTTKGKTLVLFYFDENNHLHIYRYKCGYYPSRKIIKSIIEKI